MTPTQMARRSDALYADGTCGMTRRVLCDMVAQREADLEDAREENNKLREELEAAKHDLQVFSANLARLGVENVKLRELAAGIGHLLFVLDVDYCVACPRDDINHPCPVYTVKGGECLYKTDLRELGVEVDG